MSVIPARSFSSNTCAIDLNNFTYVRSSPPTSRFIQCIDMSPDGKHFMHSVGIDNAIVTRSTSGTPFDIAEMWSLGTVGLTRPGTRGVPACRWTPDGLGFYCVVDPGLSAQTLQYWTLATPYTMGNRVAPFPTLVSTRSTSDTPAGNSGWANFNISPDGTRLLCMLNDSSRSIAQYNYGTPWDITTLTYIGLDTPTGNGGGGLFVPPSGNCAYTPAGNIIQHWPISNTWTASLVDPFTPRQTFYTNTNPPTVPDVCPPNRTECRIDSLWLNDNNLYIAVQNVGTNNSIIHQYSR